MASYTNSDNYKAAVSLNWMVNIFLYLGKDEEPVRVYACPWDCLSVAKRLWTSVPGALSVRMSLPSIAGEDWSYSEFFRNQRRIRKVRAEKVA